MGQQPGGQLGSAAQVEKNTKITSLYRNTCSNWELEVVNHAANSAGIQPIRKKRNKHVMFVSDLNGFHSSTEKASQTAPILH